MGYEVYSFLIRLNLVIYRGNNMKYMKTRSILTSLLILATLLSLSCATVSCGDSKTSSITMVKENQVQLPRKSFLKTYRNVNFKICNPEKPEECENRTMRSTGSGFVISNIAEGGFMMTAAHVCNVADMVEYVANKDPNVTYISDTTVVEDVAGNRYEAIVLEMDEPADLCVTFVHGITNPPVKISYFAPIPGDTVHNLAAPVGFFGVGMIPTLHGSFNGHYGRYAAYSVPAVGGSSGSPLFNVAGEVIGMIHSVHTRFQFLTFSPTHSEIYKMASKYINL